MTSSSSSSSASTIRLPQRPERTQQQHRQQQQQQSFRSKSGSNRRSVTPLLSHYQHSNLDNDSGRVRVAVRVRPRTAEELVEDADYADCIELLPELKRLKVRKNNWSSESYKFDEVFTETASQKRIYEAVAKPVVESVLNGYNGTVMAYGQTGTGKTYTVGRLGKDDASERGIMVRAVEDIIASRSCDSDVIEVSYLQLYMESVQDLLAPQKINIPINEDPRTGDVTLPSATVVQIQDLGHFLELLQIGEANRHAANTKQNTESSRSHAILMVYVRRSVNAESKDESPSQEKENDTYLPGGSKIPKIRKSKFLIVDLAGSERLDKSGSEGHLLEEAKFINLSLTSLGKCINALAENSQHIPTRESKLTRLLRDSFGGTARTSLIITIGPSARHQAETTSTIMFGQRAMKITNMVKLKEEFDYESLSRKLESQVDHLTAEIERERKLRCQEKHDLEKKLEQYQGSFDEVKKALLTRSEFLEKENTRLESEMNDIVNELETEKHHNGLTSNKVAQLETRLKQSQVYEGKMSELKRQLEEECGHSDSLKEQLNLTKKLLNEAQMSIKQHEMESSTYQKALADTTQMYEKKISEFTKQLEDEHVRFQKTDEELSLMKDVVNDCRKSIQQHETENWAYQKALADATQMYENKIAEMTRQLETKQAYTEVAELVPTIQQNSIQVLREIDEPALKLKDMNRIYEISQNEFRSLKSDYEALLQENETLRLQLLEMSSRLLAEENQRKSIEQELAKLKKIASENDNGSEDKNVASIASPKSSPLKESLSSRRATIAKICEEVGLQKILQLLTSEDSDVQIHAVKVIANLAAEDTNQEKIIEEGGLDALLRLLKSSENVTILRVASGAIANLAMNEMNQGLIMSKGGAELLSKTASKTNDSQTLRMVAGALANLCGNERLHMMLKEDGGIKALLEMARFGNLDVIAQVARGIANFAKCESREVIQGHKKGRSPLIEEGALEWLIANCNITSASTRRHVEIAICHLAQNEDNAKDFILGGGLRELKRVSVESSREDIRNLAKKILKTRPIFQSALP